MRGAVARLGLDGWRERLRQAPGASATDAPVQLGVPDVMTPTLDGMQSQLARFRLAGYFPDVLVTVPKDVCRTGDFHRADEMIGLGRKLTVAALDRVDRPAGSDARTE